MQKIKILVFLLICATSIYAQITPIKKAPKQISFEIGYRNVFTLMDRSSVSPFVNNASNGYGFLLDYGWKLSGLDGKKPGVFLTVPMGYTILYPDNATDSRISMLNYGWSLRHELSLNPKIVPFVGYGLFLNNLKVNGTPGSVNGHQTQFEFGTNFNTSSRLKYFAKVQLSYTSYPKIGVKERIHFMFADLRLGFRF